MPKPKPKTDLPLAPVNSWSLTTEQLCDVGRRAANDRKLLRHLGLREPDSFAETNDQDRILREVDILVSGFKPFLTDTLPSDAYWREGLLPILADTEKLRSTLGASPVRDYLDALCERSDLNFLHTDQALAKLCDTLQQEVARLKESESRGRPRGDMLANLICSLGTVFDREYRGNASKKRVRRGAVVSLSPYERARCWFVKRALRSRRVYCPTGLWRYLRQRPEKR